MLGQLLTVSVSDCDYSFIIIIIIFFIIIFIIFLHPLLCVCCFVFDCCCFNWATALLIYICHIHCCSYTYIYIYGVCAYSSVVWSWISKRFGHGDFVRCNRACKTIEYSTIIKRNIAMRYKFHNLLSYKCSHHCRYIM